MKMHRPQPEYLRWRWSRAAARFQRAISNFDRIAAKYSPDQPRVPGGQPGAGQWTSGEGNPALLAAPFAGALDGLPTLLAGGFDASDLEKTAQQFTSEKCQGRIRAVLPGQFLNMPIADILALAKSGDAAAKRCKKVLERDDYRK